MNGMMGWNPSGGADAVALRGGEKQGTTRPQCIRPLPRGQGANSMVLGMYFVGEVEKINQNVENLGGM